MEQPEDVVLTKRERLEEELADVLIYSLMMADNLNFDVEEIINKKLVKNAQKYPIDQVLAKNKSDLEAKN